MERDYTPMEVARAVRRLYVAMAEMRLDLDHRMDMTSAELLALVHLGIDGEVSPTQLAHRLRMRSSAITALLDRLTEHGHVIRERHPSDRRKLVVRLTDDGRRAAMHELRPMVADIVALVGRLPEGDGETVGRFIDDLAEVVRRRRPEGEERPPGAGA